MDGVQNGADSVNEIDLMHGVMLAASQAGNMIFRTNVGKVRMADGRWFDTGLPTPEQVKFLQAVINRGGIGGVAYSVAEAMAIIAWLPETQEQVKGALDKWALKTSAK